MINSTLRSSAIFVALFVISSCGGKSPTGPTAPVPATVSLVGTVMTLDGVKISDATIRIDDGLNSGKSTTTNTDGEYRFDDLAASNGHVSAVADGYDSVVTAIHIDGSKPLDFRLRTTEPWSKSGIGNAVFQMPLYVTRVNIVGVYTGVSASFVVHVGRCAIVEDLLGTGGLRTRSEGTYLVIPAGNSPPRTDADGTVEIIDSPGVSWYFTEDRSSSGGGPCYLY
jgi:hypothetical protein